MLFPLSATALDVPGPLVETSRLESNLQNVVILGVHKKVKRDSRSNAATVGKSTSQKARK